MNQLCFQHFREHGDLPSGQPPPRVSRSVPVDAGPVRLTRFVDMSLENYYATVREMVSSGRFEHIGRASIRVEGTSAWVACMIVRWLLVHFRVQTPTFPLLFSVPCGAPHLVFSWHCFRCSPLPIPPLPLRELDFVFPSSIAFCAGHSHSSPSGQPSRSESANLLHQPRAPESSRWGVGQSTLTGASVGGFVPRQPPCNQKVAGGSFSVAVPTRVSFENTFRSSATTTSTC